MMELARQYGGYGGVYGGYGGYVECCEGVVDPILLLGVIVGLAALTWWLRLQVVTFIAGRRRRSLTSNYLEDLQDLTKTVLGADQYHHVKTEPGLPCYTKLAGCIGRSALLGFQAEDEVEVMEKAGLGLVEFLVTGDIKTSWSHLGHRDHIRDLPSCLQSLSYC